MYMNKNWLASINWRKRRDVGEKAQEVGARRLSTGRSSHYAMDVLLGRLRGVRELRFFGGLSVEETAEVLKVSPQSVMRDWKMARAWLMAEISH